MFKMQPYFVVEPFADWGREPFAPPYMALVEKITKLADDDSYLCRLVELPALPGYYRMAILRLEGVAAPDGDFLDKIRAEAVRAYAERRLLGARQLALHDFRRDAAARLLADVLAELLDGIAKEG